MPTDLVHSAEFVDPKRSKVVDIPPEVLAQVFVWAVDNKPVVFPPEFSDMQWVLSRVCRQWRNTAISESHLWSRIEVWPVDDNASSKMVALINDILPPNGPLSIAGSENLTIYRSLFIMEQIVIPYLPRIRELQLNLGHLAYVRFFAAPPESFASTETLDISIPISYHQEDERSNKIIQAIGRTSIFIKAHRLRNLRVIGGIGMKPRMLALVFLGASIPWHQLVSLEFRPDALEAKKIYSILRQTAVLQIFRATMNDSWREEKNTDDIVLPYLHTFTLWLGRSSVLKPLILPALKYLHLDGLVNSSSYAIISHMLSRSNCSLDVFEGRGRVDPDTQAMIDLMSSIPTVQKFVGDTLWLDDTIFEMIGRGELLPRVSHLTCGMNTTKAFVEALEMRMMKAAQAGAVVTPIQVAVGQCPRLRMCSDEEKAKADVRLDALNKNYGTRFSIEWIVASRD